MLAGALSSACCEFCFLSVGIHICSLPHHSIWFPFQLVCWVCLFVNEGIQHAVTKLPIVVVTQELC